MVEFKVFQDRALAELAEKIELSGFRPGKAPLALVKEKVGVARVLELATEHAIQKHYFDIVQKEDLNVIDHSEAKIVKAENELEAIIIGSLFPEITLPDYAAIARTINQERRAKIVVENQEIDESLKWLRESRVKQVTVTRDAQKGDRVEIDFTVKDNGVLIEGGSSQNHPMIIGAERFVLGFEDRLIGMKVGETKDFKLAMPKDYPNKLGGKELNFRVTIKLVQERILPDLTDDFAKELGKFTSVDDLKKNIHEGIRREKEQKERQRLDLKIAEKIAAQATVEVPETLVQRELEKMLREFESSIARMGMELPKYLEHLKKTAEDLKKEWLQDAEKRVIVALALRAIAAKEKIEPTEEEVLIKANNSLAAFRAEGHNLEKIDKTALMEYNRSILRNEKVFEFLERV